jgi:hypothetical protein
MRRQCPPSRPHFWLAWIARHGIACQARQSKSLLEQLPEIVPAGKRQAERILEVLESRR